MCLRLVTLGLHLISSGTAHPQVINITDNKHRENGEICIFFICRYFLHVRVYSLDIRCRADGPIASRSRGNLVRIRLWTHPICTTPQGESLSHY